MLLEYKYKNGQNTYLIDYKKEDFEDNLENYDFVLHSNRDPKILEQSLRILKSGGQLISLVGPPTPEFAQEIGLPWHLKFVTKLLSSGAKKKAEKLAFFGGSKKCGRRYATSSVKLLSGSHTPDKCAVL